VNHCKPRELGVASANLHSWLGSHVVSARPWFWGSTKKPSTTSSCCSCHHAARTWPRWPPGPSNEAYLSSPHLEASPATTFRACSSPAPTRVNRNLHLQYLAKNESTQRCQSLITQGSDHPPILEQHMVLIEDTWELLEKTSRLLKDQLEYLLASGCFKYSWGLLSCSTQGRLRTTCQGHQEYSKLSCSTTKYLGACRMDLPGPTTSVGTRTNCSLGLWGYSACATRHLMAWGARTTVEKYSDRKLYMSCTV
jgi:hypothetical protein